MINIALKKTMRPWPQMAQRLFRERHVKDTVIIAAIRFASMPVTFAISVVLARSLEPAAYGTYAFALSMVGLISLALSGGFSQLVTREVAVSVEMDQPGRVISILRFVTKWVLGFSCLGIALVYIAIASSSTIASDPRAGMMALAILSLPMISMTPVWAGALRGFGYNSQSQLPFLLIMPLLQIALLMAVVSLGRLTVQTAMWAYLAACLTTVAIGVSLMRRLVAPQLRSATVAVHDIAWGSSWLTFTTIVLGTYLNSQAGLLLLGLFADPSEAGHFQIAERGAQFVALSIAISEFALAPHVARAYKAGRVDDLRRIFRQTQLGCGAVAFVVAFPLIAFGRPIVSALYGDLYADGVAPVLGILAGAMFIRACLGPTTTFLIMSGHERKTLVCQTAATLISVVLIIALIPAYGATGAAVGVAAGIVFWSIMLAREASKVLRANSETRSE